MTWAKGGAPQKDWVPNRLGPEFPASMATVQKQAFNAVLASLRRSSGYV